MSGDLGYTRVLARQWTSLIILHSLAYLYPAEEK